ncbi:MAG: hypothetical protein AAGE03_03340 [Pseudomonadota bacterium]
MTMTSTNPAGFFSAVTVPTDGTRRPGRALRTAGLTLLTMLAAIALAVLLLDPFAPQNTHPTPEMLAAWEEMMRDG